MTIMQLLMSRSSSFEGHLFILKLMDDQGERF